MDLGKTQQEIVNLIRHGGRWSTKRVAWELKVTTKTVSSSMRRLEKRDIVFRTTTGSVSWWTIHPKAKEHLNNATNS
jgi:Mn-dependent DtxR family transcriptional regulator